MLTDVCYKLKYSGVMGVLVPTRSGGGPPTAQQDVFTEVAAQHGRPAEFRKPFTLRKPSPGKQLTGMKAKKHQLHSPICFNGVQVNVTLC